jgi:hypothetical protein
MACTLDLLSVVRNLISDTCDCTDAHNTASSLSMLDREVRSWQVYASTLALDTMLTGIFDDNQACY